MRSFLMYVAVLFVVSGLCACGPVLPKEGNWVATLTLDSNTCNAVIKDDELTTEPSKFSIAHADGTVKLTFEDAKESIVCRFSDGKWVCDSINLSESVPLEGAKVKLKVQTSFTVAGDGTLTGTQSVTGSCEGDNCSKFESASKQKLPCEVKMNFSAKLE